MTPTLIRRSLGTALWLQVGGELGFDPSGVHGEPVLGGERRVSDDGAVEGNHRGDAVDLQLAECSPAVLEGLRPVGASNDDLGEQGVKFAVYLVAHRDPRLDAHAWALGHHERRDAAWSGEEVPRGVLGVDAELEGVPTGFRVVGEPQRLPCGDQEHLPH